MLSPLTFLASLLVAGLAGLSIASPVASTAALITHKPAADFTFFDIPHPAAGPCDLETGQDGAEYVQYLFSEKIARIDPVTGNITEWDIPFKGPLGGLVDLPKGAGGKALLACVVRKGRDGNIYAANGLRNQLVKLDMKTKKVSVFTPPGLLSALGNLQPLNDLWGTKDGMYFTQTTANVVTRFDYVTHKFTSWPVLTLASLPLGIVEAADGNLWFTELAGQKIASLNPTTGRITEYPLPADILGPAVMRVQLQKRYLYFTGALSDSVASIDIQTGAFKNYPNTAPVSAASVPSEDTADSQGNVWFSTWTQNLLHRLDPRTGKMEHIAIAGTDVVAPVSLPFGFGIGLDYYNVNGANQIYFTQATLNRVGRYQLH